MGPPGSGSESNGPRGRDSVPGSLEPDLRFRLECRTSMDHLILTLNLIGALGVFLYGLKVMSEALQKAAGKKG